jgi:hypothetical protein
LNRLSTRPARDKPDLQTIRDAVEQALGQPNRFARDAAIYFMRVRIRRPSREIAAFYELSPSTVGAVARKMGRNLAWNVVVKNVLDCVEKDITGTGL